MTEALPIRRLVARLLLVVVTMFCFGVFVLPPLYDSMCKALGINGKTAGAAYEGAQAVNEARTVRVQFLATNSADMVWEFRPKNDELLVHPGAVNEMLFVASNPSKHVMKAQAVPSIAPSVAAAYFHKTECFCFTQQVLEPGQRIEMPVRFIVDRDLPEDVHHLTLAYTLFDITATKSPAKVAGR